MNTKNNLIKDPLLAEVPIYENYRTLKPVLLYGLIQRGRMGAVYKGCHLRLNIDVSVKVMTPPPWIEPKEMELYVNRFMREAQTAAGIIHQNLVNVYDVNRKHGIYYLIMEFIDGETVDDRLKRQGGLPEIEALEITKHAATGMAAAHDKGIIHRDIKPGNIMISRDGNIKVTDLGLAKAVNDNVEHDGEMTMVGTIIGTPYFMSPEQTVSAKDVGPESDVWSMGVTLYQLLSNNIPFYGNDLSDLIYNIRNTPLPDLKKIIPNLSNETCKIIAKSLEKDISKRYTNLKEMRDHVDHCLNSLYEQHKSPIDSYTKTPIPKSNQPPPPNQKTILKVADLLEMRHDAEKGNKQAQTPEPAGNKIADKQIEKKLSRQQKKVREFYSKLDDPKFKKYAKPKNRLHLNNLLDQIGTHIKNEDHMHAESAILTASKLIKLEESKMEELSKNKPFIIVNIILIVAAIVIPIIILLSLHFFG